MASKLTQVQTQRPGLANALKGWTMVILTTVFLLLYAAALTGWLKPLADDKTVARLEPIIFVIIGYYFGRLPAQQSETTLRDEIIRQTQKADAAQHAKEQAQQIRETLEEKLKNARVALASVAPSATAKSLTENVDRTNGPVNQDTLRQSVSAAFNILNS
jgi:ElaB/YqjD/DUF883 family membrane-anchored ribosome-binding protein